jgi:hypothetical protein
MSTIHSLSPATMSVNDQPAASGLDLATYTRWLHEIQNQPAWRAKADKHMDYVDGNQLDSDLLRRQAQIGIPPAIENLIGPAVDSVTGLEAKTRTDWRITADTDGGDDVAAALNFKVNQAERKSGADKACSEAFRPQYCVGIGWVEVARESDPFLFPYRCRAVHRNEIFWDMLDREPGLPKARWLIRRRWTDAAQVVLKFPDAKDLVSRTMGRWLDQYAPNLDGGTSTTLGTSWQDERGWSIEEQEWRDLDTGRVCLFEVWYRRWEQCTVLRLPDGRVVEYDKSNALHVLAVASGRVKPMKSVVAKMYCSYWMGPHKLYDGPTPYRHNEFPYVQFVGKLEDRTGVPYGAVKGAIYLQDQVNSAIAKIRWGLSAMRSMRTKGAYAGTDEQFRQMIARPDADIVLDDTVMAKNGAMFKVERDFQLSEQQYKMLVDSRTAIERVMGAPSSFQGQNSTATSGVQESTQIEQATQTLATIMDNFRFGRTKVGELLLSLVIEDMIGKPETVIVKGTTGLRPDRPVQVNVPTTDEDTGVQYLTNDVERIRLKVAMNDVPSTPSFRTQQLNAMSEAFKSMPQEFQVVALPHLLSLMDVPNRDELLEDIKKAQAQSSPEAIQQRIDEAVKQALQMSDHDIRSRELDLKYAPDRQAAETAKIVSETVMNNLKTFFAAMQAGEVITAVPAVAPVADSLVLDAGFQHPSPTGQTPGFPTPGASGPITVNPVKDGRTGMEFTPAGQQAATGAIPSNTDPMSPAVPASPFKGPNSGIETMRASDNQP